MKAMRCLVFLGGMVLLAGCATISDHMTPVAKPMYKPSNTQKSLVLFVRPSKFGGVIQATLYDGLKYIGTISATQQVAYETTPGKHMFMVVAESADFMQANLLPNKTYYAAIVARPGAFKARFSFRPQNGQIPKVEFDKWLATTTQVRVNQQGLNWCKAHYADVVAKHDEYLPRWHSKKEVDKQILRAKSGV
jgi:hypothetical protein